ncbi:MAG: hypothetical protein J5759_01335 [Bacteroidales bacterium]|nr:hypothetical protein [Bacteroidales bacterium]
MTAPEIEQKKQQLAQLKEQIAQLEDELAKARALELSEDDLDNAAGGIYINRSNPPKPKGII